MKARLGLGALFVLGASAALSRPAAANGFLIYDLSGEAIGRGSAVSASVSEPAAVWFNPGALVFMEGVSASAGAVLVTARSHFESRDGSVEASSERGNFVLPTLFAAARLNRDIAVGLGAYSAFGIGIRWPDDWLGRESIVAASLETLAINPTLTVRLAPGLGIGAGFDAIRSTVDYTNGLPSLVGGNVRLAGGSWGYGFNAGIQYRVVPDELHFALTYRSRVKLRFEGQSNFDPTNVDFARSLPDQPGSAALTLPDIITFGVMGRPRKNLALSFDANVVLWSTYDRVDIDFREAPDRILRPKGQNTFMLRAGFDWSMPKRGFHLRGGLIYDHAAIPEEGLGPGLPDANRIDVTSGLGYTGENVKLDVGYMLVYFLPADARSGREGPEGTYRSLAHLLGLTAGVSFQ